MLSRNDRREETKLVYLPIRGGSPPSDGFLLPRRDSRFLGPRIALLRGIGDRIAEQPVKSLIAPKQADLVIG